MLDHFRKSLFSAVRGRGLSRLPGASLIIDSVHAMFRQRFAEAHGFTLELDPGDALGLSVFGDFEKAETDLVRQVVQPGQVVIDLGAHIGYYTLLFAKLVGPSGRVYAFEPAPETFELLERNIARSNMTNIEAHNAAAGARSEQAQLFLSPNCLDHHVFDVGSADGGVPITMVTVDDVVPESQPAHFIKMDIQGGEPAALRGMQQLLARSPDVRILTEFWPVGISRAGFSPDEFLGQLTGLGCQIYELDDRSGALEPSDPGALLERSWGPKQSTYLFCERRPSARYNS